MAREVCRNATKVCEELQQDVALKREASVAALTGALERRLETFRRVIDRTRTVLDGK